MRLSNNLGRLTRLVRACTQCPERPRSEVAKNPLYESIVEMYLVKVLKVSEVSWIRTGREFRATPKLFRPGGKHFNLGTWVE